MRDVFSSQQKTIFVLIGVATLVRLGYIAFLARYEILRLPILDAEYYVEWATNIIQHGWLGERIFFTEPLYAYLLALFLKIFGEHTWLPAMLGLQFVLGALFPVLLFAVGTKLFSRSIGIVAGLIAALYGPFVFYDGLLLKTSLEVYSIPLFLLVFWHAMEHPKTRTFVFAGLMLGVIALIKGNVLIFVPLACLFIFFFLEPFVLQRRLLFIGAFVMGVIACIAPITLRNYLVGQDIVPTNYSIGLVLYQGNWWGGDGSTARVPSFLRPHPKYEERDAVGMAESYQGHVLKPSEVSRFWMSKTLAEITDAPNHFLATLWHKVLLLLNYREYSDNYSYAFYRSYIPFLWILPGYFFVILCGGVGLVLLFFKHFEAMIVNAHALAMKEQALARFRRTRRMLFWFF
ncbi:MAG TPA: glycosyltransferase family 39 protein, partial [Patescibacteria group bacterium]|nr:glycosyltransferase family 39 protein [Patescibacteria group bacterium]